MLEGESSAGERWWQAWGGQKAFVAMKGGWMTRRIAGLGVAKTVSVAVQAVNEAGVSAWVHAPAVTTPSKRPEAPLDVTLDVHSHKNLVLRWKRGDEGGSEVVLYRVSMVQGCVRLKCGRVPWPLSTAVPVPAAGSICDRRQGGVEVGERRRARGDAVRVEAAAAGRGGEHLVYLATVQQPC